MNTAEDILEWIYTNWKLEKEVYPKDVYAHFLLPREVLQQLEEELERRGCLKKREKAQPFCLTELGKVKGEEYLLRHFHLTRFLQLTCGLEEKTAKENANRIEAVIDKEVACGILKFLNYGNTYDRIVPAYDLHSVYEEGKYTFTMSLYRIEERNPRIVAEEAKEFSDTAELEIGAEKNFFYLTAKEKSAFKLWYLDKQKWILAKKEADRYQIPAEAFAYTVSSLPFLTECDCVIGFTNEEIWPDAGKCRELNIHIW